MKNLMLSSVLYVFCFISITIYTLTIYFVGQTFWPDTIKGSLILDKNNNIRGSYLIAQHLKDSKYFKPRPTIDILIHNYDEKETHEDVTMITTSSSKIDPFITKKQAIYQSLAISKARGIDINKIHILIDQHTLHKQKVFFDLDIVNTSILNAELDGYSKP